MLLKANGIDTHRIAARVAIFPQNNTLSLMHGNETSSLRERGSPFIPRAANFYPEAGTAGLISKIMKFN